MSQAQYRVILTGTLASGADPAQAQANLAQLFKLRRIGPRPWSTRRRW